MKIIAIKCSNINVSTEQDGALHHGICAQRLTDVSDC